MSEFRERLLGDERRARRVARCDLDARIMPRSLPSAAIPGVSRDTINRFVSGATAKSPDHALVARQIADAIDHCMQRHRWEQAERLARQATRLAPSSLRLTECLARLHLVQGNVDAALGLVDRGGDLPDSHRLLRTICFLHAGRAAEAHLELHDWCRRTTAPLAARTLLALLDWDAGDADAAHDQLVRNLKHIEDPQSLALLVVINAARGRMELAAHWSQRLRAVRVDETEAALLDVLLETLGCAKEMPSQEASRAQVMTLAAELTAQEHLIPALVHAQELEPHVPSARMLARAVQQALPDLVNQASALESLARLWLAVGDVGTALHWARRAAAASPMSAAAAILVQQVEQSAQHALQAGNDQPVLRVASDDSDLDRAAA